MPNTEYLKIPRERVGVVIGKNGTTKDEIENLTKTSITVDSEAGISCNIPNRRNRRPIISMESPLHSKSHRQRIQPGNILKLMGDETILEIINLPDYVGKSKKAILRQKARIIGKEGRTKDIITDMTGVDISIYGKTVAIIGDMEQIQIAKEAVEMILNGVRHKTVYAFLEKKTRDMKIKQFHRIAKDETDIL